MGIESDVQYRGTFDIDEILSAFDVIDRRAQTSAQRMRTLDQQSASARAKGLRDEQRALEYQQRQAAAVAKGRLAEEARALKATVDSENRARREAAQVAQRMFRDQAAEAKRSAKEEERAFIASIRAEEAQRREAARIAKSLQQDQMREEKRVLAERSRIAKQFMAEQEAASRQASGATSYFSGGLAQAFGIIAGGNLVASAIVGTFHLLSSAIQEAGDAIYSLVSAGIAFNQQMETAARAISALIDANYQFKNSNGQVVDGYEAFNAATLFSKGVLDQLRIAAIRTPLTFEELALGFQQTAAVAGQAGIKIDELVPLTVSLGSAVKTLGLDSKQVAQEIRGLLSGKVGPSEQLARALGITGAMVKDWKLQGTLVAELTKRLEPFNIALQKSMDNADVLLSTLQDIGLNFARASTGTLFSDLEKAGVILRDGLIDPITGQFTPALAGAARILDELLAKFGDVAQVLAVKIIAAVDKISEYLIEHRAELGRIEDVAGELLYTIGRLIGEIFTMIGNVLGVNKQVSAEYKQQDSFLVQVESALRTIQTVLEFISRLIHTINAITDSWVGQLISALNPLNQIANALHRAYEEYLKITHQSAPGATNFGGQSYGTAAGVFGGGPRIGGGFQLNQGYQFNKPGSAYTASARPPAGPGGGGGGGGSRKADVDEGAKIILQLQQENSLLREAEGYDRSLLRIKNEQADSEARIAGLLKEHKISIVDAATANRYIHDQMVLQTAELDKQARESVDKTRLDLAKARLKLDKDEYGLMRLEAVEANNELRKRLERELGADRQLKIDTLVKRDMELRLADIQRVKDERAVAAQKEIIKLIEDQTAEMQKQFDLVEEYRRKQIEEGRQRVTALKEQNYADLKGLFGEGGLDQARRLQQDADALTELGLTMQDLARYTGFAATNLASLHYQIEAIKAAQKGDIFGTLAASLKAATFEILLSVDTFTKLGQAIGNALLGNANSIKEFGKYVLSSILSLMGQIAINLGTMLILVGLGLSSVPFLFGLSGGAAIAAGAALVAFGVGITALATVVSGSGQGGAAASGAEAPGGSNVADIGQARERRTRRQEFETSGESRERRPSSFIPGVGGQDAMKFEIDLYLNGGDEVASALISKHEFVTVSGLGRGKVRTKVRKRVA